jgi:type I restriction enzyme S subunit
MRNLDFRDYLRVYLPVPLDTDEQHIIAELLRVVSDALNLADKKVLAARRVKTSLSQNLFTEGIPGQHQEFRTAKILRHEFVVPRVWHFEPLKLSITSLEYGTNQPSNDAKRGLPVVAIPQVIAPRFKLGECPYAELSKAEADSLRLAKDDVLLIRTNGNADYIGKSTVIGDEADTQHIVFASYLIRVRTNIARLMGRYLNYFLGSPLGRRQCLAMANTSAGNHNLGARSIKSFCIPLPNLQEQAEIVDVLDAAENAIESAESELQQLEILRTSMLQNLMTGRYRVRL